MPLGNPMGYLMGGMGGMNPGMMQGMMQKSRGAFNPGMQQNMQNPGAMQGNPMNSMLQKGGGGMGALSSMIPQMGMQGPQIQPPNPMMDNRQGMQNRRPGRLY